MERSISLLAATLLLAPPLFAAEPATKAERDRQISEIVFQNYPPRALAAGEEGPVFFTVTLDRDAHPMICEVTHGSGHPLLDQETCDLIVQHAVFSQSRDSNGNFVKVAEGVVNWTLPGHTPVPVTPVLLTGNAKPEKQICKKTVRVGTLASFERTCMTPSEWARQTDEMKQPWKEWQGKGQSVCSTGAANATGLAAEPGGISAAPVPAC
jgi:hypothetical protein